MYVYIYDIIMVIGFTNLSYNWIVSFLDPSCPSRLVFGACDFPEVNMSTLDGPMQQKEQFSLVRLMQSVSKKQHMQK